MRTARHSLLIVMAIAINAGVMYSQVCNIVCDLYGCSPSAAEKILDLSDSSNEQHESSDSACGGHKHTSHDQNEQASHHAQGEPTSIPEGHSHSHDSQCLFHVDQTALVSSATSAAYLHQPIQSIAGALPLISYTSFDELTGERVTCTSDRSPPKPTFSVLRI
jgi:hypothetical protein